MPTIDFTKKIEIYPTFTTIAQNTAFGVRDIDFNLLEHQPLDAAWFHAAFEAPGPNVAHLEGKMLLNANIIPELEDHVRRSRPDEIPRALMDTRKKLLIPGTMVKNKYGESLFLCFVHGHTWTPMRRNEDPEDVYVLTLPH